MTQHDGDADQSRRQPSRINGRQDQSRCRENTDGPRDRDQSLSLQGVLHGLKAASNTVKNVLQPTDNATSAFCHTGKQPDELLDRQSDPCNKANVEDIR